MGDSVMCQVFTGLKISGTTAADLKGQIEGAGGLTLDRLNTGETWRTGGVATPSAWQTEFRTRVDLVFKSVKSPEMSPTSVTAVTETAVQGDDFTSHKIDTGDFAAFISADAQQGAALLIHSLHEQYEMQINGVAVYGTAHTAAQVPECAVNGASSRTEAAVPPARPPASLADFQNITYVTFTYAKPSSGSFTFTFTADKRQATISVPILTGR